MKVKTLTMRMANGLRFALEGLDKQVAELGDIAIHSLKDTLYQGIPADEKSTLEHGTLHNTVIARVIIYTPVKIKDRQWHHLLPLGTFSQGVLF